MADNDLYPVLAVDWKTPQVFELVVQRNGMTFTPGDSIALATPDHPKSRPYSIASGSDEPILKFLIQRMPEGEVSTRLSQLKPGDPVRLSAPFGWFRPGYNLNGAPFVFIATGTGIAPFLAFLRTPKTPRPRRCLYGVRYLRDALELDFLRACCPMTLTLSREPIDGYHHGRVSDVIDSLPPDPGAHYYLCGLDAMIDDVSAQLERSGIPFTHIHREVFFHAPSSP